MLLNLTARFTRSQPLTSLPPSAAVLVTDEELWRDDGDQVVPPHIHYGYMNVCTFRPGKFCFSHSGGGSHVCSDDITHHNNI